MGDNLGMMQQLGVIPQPGNTEEALTLRKGHSTAWVVTRSSVTRPGGIGDYARRLEAIGSGGPRELLLQTDGRARTAE
jgi:hypothetical protein